MIMNRAQAFSALQDVYRKLEEDIGQSQGDCKACGSCCDFSGKEIVLYASRIERDFLRQASTPAKILDRDGQNLEVCPYLDQQLCRAREFRTLGCRTHFCNSLSREKGMELYEKYLREISQISREAGFDWDYRPVLAALAEESKG
jgi:Fe-S-cluster containining protein